MQVQVITAGVLVVTVSVLVTVLALLYTMPKPMRQHTCDTLCLPSVPFLHGSDLQCGCSSERLQEYLDEAIIQKVKRLEQDDKDKKNPTTGPSPQLMGMLKSLRWNIKPSARVTGKKQPPPLQDHGEMFPVREWHQKDERAFIRYGMEYRHGRLVVPVKGLYHIHSFLDLYETLENTTSTAESSRSESQTDSLRKTRNTEVNQQLAGIRHAIYRFNILNGTEEELIRNEHPREVSQNGYFNVYDSYLAAAVSLDPGDEVNFMKTLVVRIGVEIELVFTLLLTSSIYGTEITNKKASHVYIVATDSGRCSRGDWCTRRGYYSTESIIYRVKVRDL